MRKVAKLSVSGEIGRKVKIKRTSSPAKAKTKRLLGGERGEGKEKG